MHRRLSKILITTAILVSIGFVWRVNAVQWLMTRVIYAQAGAGTLPATFSDIVLPFELVNEHIFLTARVNNSRPLQFLLDTGDKFTIVDLDLAQELGLPLGSDIHVHGAGSNPARGAFVKDSSLKLPSLPGFVEPVALAIPLRNLTPRLGHDLDGILGSDFMGKFIVEVDYQRRTVTLHNRNSFHYDGSGQILPIHLTAAGHTVLHASVTPIGVGELSGDFELDLGASGALELHSPFVAEHRLPGPNVPTVPDIGRAGTGGETTGDIGRAIAFKIGKYEIKSPQVVFSRDSSGSASSSDTQGNIGEEILSRFKLFFDYAHLNIIFEPNATFSDRFDHGYSGILLAAEGKDYKTIRVKKIVPNSPGSDSGLQPDDVISAMNGQAVSALSFSAILDIMRRPATVSLTVDRAGKTLMVNVKPRAII
jgi:hypothetical protein